MPNNESATTQPPIGTTQFPLDDFRAELADLFQTQSFVTTTDLAERLDCTTETARTKLAELTNEGVLDARKVGAKAKVWSPSTMDQNVVSDLWSASKQAEQSGGSASKQSPTKPGSATTQTDERVLFFPSRREIVVDNPTAETQATLSKTARLIDSTADGYLYKIAEGDVWNTPYDSFDQLREDLREVIGDERWDGGFESRIKDDWDRAHTFRLKTGEDGLSYFIARTNNT